jgi:micrococcal nuclease
MRWIIAAALAFALALVASTTFAAKHNDNPDLVLVGKVTRVIDGDTVEVQLDSGPIHVRFASIDAPEHDQPYGTQAKALLAKLVDGKEVQLSVKKHDRYERLIATVYVGDLDVNAELVRKGAAWAYTQYLTDKSLPAIEQEARCAQRGLWAKPAEPPWKWRHGERNAQHYDCEHRPLA